MVRWASTQPSLLSRKKSLWSGMFTNPVHSFRWEVTIEVGPKLQEWREPLFLKCPQFFIKDIFNVPPLLCSLPLHFLSLLSTSSPWFSPSFSFWNNPKLTKNHCKNRDVPLNLQPTYPNESISGTMACYRNRESILFSFSGRLGTCNSRNLFPSRLTW